MGKRPELIGGGLIRSLGGWSKVITFRSTGEKEAGIEEKELRNGGQRRIVSEVRGKIGYYMNRELGLSLAEIARNLGVGTSAVAMAIRKREHE